MRKRSSERIVLAYSGGLNASIAIAWLAEQHRAEIVTVTLDLGQGLALDDVRERALAIGAARAHVLDLREELARDVVVPVLQAGALHDGRYPLVTALARPLIVKQLLEIARLEGATSIAHGCGEGIDATRFEALIQSLEPTLPILAPVRTWGMSRADVIEYARSRGIPVPATADHAPKADANLWGRSVVADSLEDASKEPAEDLYARTKSPAEAPDTPAYVEIEFDRGVPIAINGIPMSPVELIQSLETIAGAHAIGRLDRVEPGVAGSTPREVIEAPAAVALHAAHHELQKFVTPPDLHALAADLGARYADLVDRALWFTRTREAIDALVLKVQERVIGTARLKLFKGDCRVVGRTSPFALYDHDRVTDDQAPEAVGR